MPDQQSEPIRLMTIITKLELGGAQQVVLHTLRLLPRDRYRLYLVAGQGGLLDEAARALPGVEVHLWPGFKHPIRPWQDLVTGWRLLRLMKKEHIQIVHTHSSKAGILGRLAAACAGVPMIVHTVHGWPFHEYQSAPIRWGYILLERLAAKVSTVLIAVSHATREKGLRYSIGRASQYRQVFPGSDLSAFQPGNDAQRKAVRAEFGFAPESCLVGMVACFKPQKAPQDFITAAGLVAAKIPQARFLLVGDGELRPALEDQIKRMDLSGRVVLAGWREDVPRLLGAMDLLAHSARWEGLPCVFAQAQACGVAVVATDVEGTREIITSGQTGILVPAADPEALARAIIEVLKDDARRSAMGKAGQVDSKRFRLEPMLQALQEIYQSSLF